MIPLILFALAQAQPIPSVPQSPSARTESMETSWKSTAPAPEIRRRAADELRRAVDAAKAQTDDVEASTTLRSAARTAVNTLGNRSQIAGSITLALEAVDPSERNAGEKATLTALRKELDRIARDLAFSPLLESPRTRGFPSATVVGEIEVLEYPAYRMARAPMKSAAVGGQNTAFWKLFRHIQSHDIPMTAPVEMRWESAENAAERAAGAFESMSFLYVSTDVGRTGHDGEVEVLDVPAATVVSLGLRGSSNRERAELERARLYNWISARPQRFEITGPPRMMGWNSPMVADAKRYWEVQYPVRILPDAVELQK
ncbi:MAG: heme-binding protein [Planctomycetes bacterium]|nr:heme-binding protein [Planctomycetota bacterium]